mmetsp:Transcript_4798/g.7387  ORF Transcript_4798/g.7387 Transcript_4798/m.7387 type:complete len:115 (+) Transcript_4798:50-394(+)
MNFHNEINEVVFFPTMDDNRRSFYVTTESFRVERRVRQRDASYMDRSPVSENSTGSAVSSILSNLQSLSRERRSQFAHSNETATADQEANAMYRPAPSHRNASISAPKLILGTG